MNRSALKSSGFVLLGVVAGWIIRGLPERGRGADGYLLRAAGQNGTEAAHGGGLADPRGEADTARMGAKPGRERLEMLAASFRSKCGQGGGTAVRMAMSVEAGMLPPEAFGPLITLLMEDANAWEAVQLLAVRWAMLDPTAAMSFILDRPEIIKRDTRLLLLIVEELSKTDLPAARAALERVGPEERRDSVRQIVRMLLQKDARAALAYARQLGDGTAEADALNGMAQNDPVAAAAELTPGKEWPAPVVRQIAASLLKRDRTAFETWCGSLQDPGQRAAARSQALIMDAGTDAKGAAQAAAAWLAADPEAVSQTPDGSLSEWIVQRWIGNEGSPSEVAAWATALPGGPLREAAVSEVGRLWPAHDSMAASAWLASLPAGEGKDNAVQALVGKISSESPADAFEWARTMGNPSLRYETVMTTLREWAEKDSAAAQAAVETLPAGDRGYLLEALQKQEKAKAAGQK
jgi:hypothetical protein